MKLTLTLDFDRNCLSETWAFYGSIRVPVIIKESGGSITFESKKYTIPGVLEDNSTTNTLTLTEDHAEIISESIRDLLETAMLGATITDSDETFPKHHLQNIRITPTKIHHEYADEQFDYTDKL